MILVKHKQRAGSGGHISLVLVERVLRFAPA